VLPVVATLSVELPPAVMEVGVNLAVVPAGRPLTDRVMVCGFPEITAVLTV